MKPSWLLLSLVSVAVFPAVVVLLAPPQAGAQAYPGPADLDRLAAYMTGSFSSSAQARRDTSFRDIRLRMAPIWTERKDARWLYVEQAVAGAEERPYRQRIYRLSITPDRRFESAVFTLPAPSRFVGAWKSPETLRHLTPDSLTQREGCSVYLKWVDERFLGGTSGKHCASELRGAAYATSEVDLRSDRMITWDRGFDTLDRQVWGSEKGGYEFMRERPVRRRTEGGQP